MGRGLLSGLFWGGAASMVLLIMASVYFPLRDLSTHAASEKTQTEPSGNGPRPNTRALLADPPPSKTPPEAQQVATTEPGDVSTPSEAAQTLSETDVAVTPAAAPRIATALPAQQPPVPSARVAVPSGAAPRRPDEVALDTDPPERAPVRALPPVASTPETAPTAALASVNAPVPVPVTSVPGQVAQPDVMDVAQGSLVRPRALTETDRSRAMSLLTAPAPDLTIPTPSDVSPPDVTQAFAALSPGNRPEVSAQLPEAVPVTSPRPMGDPPQARAVTSAALSPDRLRAPVPPRAAPPVATRTPNSPNAGRAPETPPPPMAPPAAVPVETPETETAPDAQDTRTAQAIPAQTQAPRVLLGGGSETLVSRGPGLSARLPRIGELSPQQATATPDQRDPAPVGALTRNARSFEVPADVGLVSILLELTQGDRRTLDALTQFRAPLAIAIDPTLPGAPEWAAALRAAGHEVLIALTGLPPEPAPRDIDVALAAHIAVLPGAVGVWLPQGSSVFADRILLRHTVAVLRDTGHGLVTPLSGLDAAGQEARAAGLPSASVARRLQGAQEADLLRSLAQGALRAGSTGRYVLQAEARADTLAALETWNSGLAGQSLVLAPVSTVLLATDL